MIRCFIGFDPRQPIALQVLAHSIYRRASQPVSITPLVLSQLPIARRGLTEFTFSRYLVPHLCGFEGQGVFFDADMLCLGDVAELLALADPAAPVSVVDTGIKFERPSLMVFNNALCKMLTPENIEAQPVNALAWSQPLGLLPAEWNHLVGYNKPRTDAKLVHFTAGIPCWPETRGCEYSQEWLNELQAGNSTVPWAELMGGSVHAKMVQSGHLQRAA